MYVVCVTVFVKPEKIKDFKEATLENAWNTRQEPGNVRFNVLQTENDLSRFFLKINRDTSHFLR
jgi:(4S)-4-hydroxy-5-phosphonooxypentane-2,3-dione isomerase